MKFVDEIEVIVRSGKGGRGMVSFKADRGRPKMGCDGGDGGHGGSVYLQAAPQLNTLSGLNYHHIYQAENGVRGGSNNCTGRCGKDLVIPVPLGTVAYDAENHFLIGEVIEPGQKLMIAKGGKRGIGNARFLSPWHQAPEEYTPGGPSVEVTLRLELKLMADVGFAGLPNAGKSTLLSSISAARPRIAAYPFTTLVPYLGVVSADADDELGFGATFVAADIPGLIEGAADGKGLGHDFLRHIERTRVIAFVVDASEYADTPALDAFATVRQELESFDPGMLAKTGCIILTKTDSIEESLGLDGVKKEFEEFGLPIYPVCAITGEGIADLKRSLFRLVVQEKSRVAAALESTEKLPSQSSKLDVDQSWVGLETSYKHVTSAEPLPI